MLSEPVPTSQLKFYLFILFGMLSVILSAWAFEIIGGYIPCKLCLAQREPWYVGIPVMILAIVSLMMKWPACLTRGLVFIAGLIMLYSLALGIEHSGVEWAWWAGPSDCGAVEGGLTTNTDDFLKQLNETVPPSCDEATFRMFGLSFAGWNAFASLVLAIVSFVTAFKK